MLGETSRWCDAARCLITCGTGALAYGEHMTKSDLLILRARVGRFFSFEFLRRGPTEPGVPSPFERLRMWAALLGLIIAAVRLILLLGHLSDPPAASQTPQPVCAPFGEYKQIELPEHSRIDLNSAACVTVELSARKRLIKLDSGEAVFEVTADPRRPFVVETGPIAITVLGTRFDIFRKKVSTRVAVVEGAVQISSRDTAIRSNGKPLIGLQQMDVPDDVATSRIRKEITSTDFERITGWIHGDLYIAGNTPLKDALDEFSRYQHFHVKYEDPSIADVPFTGKFRTHDLRKFLGLLHGRCIRYVEEPQLTLSNVPGKRAGAACR